MIRPEWLDPQPPPERCAESVSVTDGLIELIRTHWPRSPAPELLILRREQGTQRYGTELTTWNGRDPDIDVLQELVDALVYAGQAYLQGRASSRKRRLARIHAEVVELAGELAARGAT